MIKTTVKEISMKLARDTFAAEQSEDYGEAVAIISTAIYNAQEDTRANGYSMRELYKQVVKSTATLHREPPYALGRMATFQSVMSAMPSIVESEKMATYYIFTYLFAAKQYMEFIVELENDPDEPTPISTYGKSGAFRGLSDYFEGEVEYCDTDSVKDMKVKQTINKLFGLIESSMVYSGFDIDSMEKFVNEGGFEKAKQQPISEEEEKRFLDKLRRAGLIKPAYVDTDSVYPMDDEEATRAFNETVTMDDLDDFEE